MARRTAARGVIAALAVLAVTAGPGPLSVPAGAETAVAADTVFQSDRYVPRGDHLYAAGASGYLHAQEGSSGYLWTSYDTGTTTELGALARLDLPAYLGSSADTVADVVSPTEKVVLRDMAAGTSTDVAITHGRYMATYGGHVLTQAQDADGNRVLWLYGDGAPAEGTVVDGWPTGITANFTVLGGDSGTAVISYTLGYKRHLALVDLAAAKVVGDVTVSAAPTAVALSADRLVWYASGPTAHVLNRADLSAAETTVRLPGTEGTPTWASPDAGSWSPVQCPRTRTTSSTCRANSSWPFRWQAVTRSPCSGTRTPRSPRRPTAACWSRAVPTPGTGRYGRSPTQGGRADSVADDCRPSDDRQDRPAVAAERQPGHRGGRQQFHGRLLHPPSLDHRDVLLAGHTNLADVGRLRKDGPLLHRRRARGDVHRRPHPQRARVTRRVDRQRRRRGHLLQPLGRRNRSRHHRPLRDRQRLLPAKQYVGDLGVYTDLKPILTRSVTAASVWGTRLWTPGTANGYVNARDLKTGKTTDSVNTGAPCIPKELQAVGRWIYWSCGPTASAGVWDRTAKKNIPVPSGEALLGDGYLVRHDTSAGALLLTDFADGSAATRKIGDLAVGNSSLRGVTWTVDKFGGPAAYVDADHRIHLVPSGVAAQPLAVTESEVTDNAWESSASTNPWWQWRGLLSKPASSWTATFTSKATGAVVRTLTGGEVDGNLTARWNLRDTAGALVPNGAYTLKLTARPADRSGAALTMSQAVNVSTGAAVRRDFTNSGTWAPDGIGDILTLSSSGVISYRPGTGKGTFGPAMAASGWPSSVTPVPFGDLNGDRRNDILVRFSNGELRAYRTMRGQAFLTGTPHTSLGTGWNQYNLLTSPGDITGDGRPDLIARKASTGELFLYKGTSAGKLSARVRIAANWSGYKKIVGVGDFNGDGRGDLLAQDKSNILWRYDGTGTGGFRARVKVATGWGSNYNTVIGVGDITGDAKADIVSRDTAGNVWRNSGNGKGALGARTRIATGWQAYRGLY